MTKRCETCGITIIGVRASRRFCDACREQRKQADNRAASRARAEVRRTNPVYRACANPRCDESFEVRANAQRYCDATCKSQARTPPKPKAKHPTNGQRAEVAFKPKNLTPDQREVYRLLDEGHVAAACDVALEIIHG